ncbi:MAG: DAK2 domain-containing protein [Gammaproteobacteria bacterium]|nr:DAK2 domain-containing protein [Gammaproteobacteria bacterium]
MIELSGRDFIDVLTSMGHYLKAASKKIDELNVFPVPDGDTGSNMSSTFLSGLRNIKDITGEPTVSQVANKFARGLLYGARGNSGVILSQYFAGITTDGGSVDKASIQQVKDALVRGMDYAYKAVLVPVEGTILTVIKDATYAIKDIEVQSLEELATIYKKTLETSLENTPNLLPVLKEAGVVDSGAAGITELIEGVQGYFRGERYSIDEVLNTQQASTQHVDFDNYDFYSLNTYGYCTEFTIKLNPDKTFNKEEFTVRLESFGTSIVVVHQANIVKAHVHTRKPGDVFNFAQEYGALCLVKADNMAVQTEENSSIAASKVRKELNEAIVKEREPYGLISVVNGEGLKEIFTDLGCSIIEGGQTMNPSTKDFIDAIDAINADVVYIIPNNKNVFLSAKQAKALVNDKNVQVVPAKTISQGYASLLVFDGSLSPDENMREMEQKIKTIRSGEVTYAIRNSVSSGVEIHKGDYISILDSQIINSTKTRLESVKDLISSMVTNESMVLSIFYGEDVEEEELSEIESFIRENFDLEPQILSGGQKVYSYIIEVE